jgi:hypothetical protein
LPPRKPAPDLIRGRGTQARAGRGSLAQAERLTRIETRVTEHVARLKRELEEDPAGPERRRQERVFRAATEQEVRLRRARARLAELEEEKRERAKTHAKAEAAKSAPAVSTSDPEVRSMKLALGLDPGDGGRCHATGCGTCKWPPRQASW